MKVFHSVQHGNGISALLNSLVPRPKRLGLGTRLISTAMDKEHSRFMTIPDILGGTPADLHGTIVRTIGLLLRYDVSRSQIWIKDVTSLLELAIDSSMIEPFPFKPNALYQFIGELDGSGRSGGISGVVLKAHTYRCVDKLDLGVYMQAHALRFQGT